ncbi:DEAD/DEAH box helicase [Lutibacter holmesii]|uniref:DEAD/DEAH box helicase n=1 Tax=Lutibacter holmesii TaxID=1137985 RepID=A0ABW3WMS2_9FLAO
MKIHNIFKGKKDEINLNIKPLITGESFKYNKNTPVEINYSQDAYWLVVDKDRIEVEGITAEDNKELERIAHSNKITLLVTSKSNKAEIKAKLLTNIISLDEGLEICLTDIIIDDIENRFKQVRQFKKKINWATINTDWLSYELIIEDGGRTQILLDNSPGVNGFRIFGKSIAIDVKKNDNEKFEITRILKWNNRFNPTFLLKGDIQIKDISNTATLRQTTELKLNRIDSTERYIKTWESYQEKEKENSIKEVKKRGFLTITKTKRITKNKYKLVFDRNDNTSNWLNIQSGSYIVLNKTQVFPDFYSNENRSKNRIILKLLEKHNNHLITESEKGIDTTEVNLCYASLSPLGDVIANKRRTDALNVIRNNSAPMPVLSAVLEGVDYDSVSRRRIKPLTSKVKDEFGKFGPNEMQELALDVALNSPDITIIQGPPGTGKTKVISALAKRLTEIYKDNGDAPEMNILLTAFQHDAVENMAARTEVLGLPAIKFSNTQHQSIDVIDKWIIKQTEKVEAIQNGIEPNKSELIYNDIIASYLSYIKTLNQEKAKNDLLRIRKENISTLPDDIIEDISNLSREELKTDSTILNKVIENLRNIRTDNVSYSDDGEMNLNRFLRSYKRYQNELPKIDTNIIEEIEEYLIPEKLMADDFAKLSDLKLGLIDSLKSVNINETIKLSNAKIESAFKKSIDFFAQKIQSNGSVYSVLSEFQNDLHSNKDRVKETIQNYVALAASTVQGSKGKKMTAIKPDPFDTVIVDEAARANPLDLLIPLTSAKRRIVLVGDHRQLPHIVDNAIQKELEEDELAAKDVSKFLKDSLFERFYNILKKLNEKDGIQRVVTLNTQYRMHPVIGDFISKTFYEKYGDPKINSGTPAEKLTHNIHQYQEKVAVSINIPNIKGEEKKQSGSTFRPIEAKEAIRRAKEILDSDPSMSLGIITFYSRQVEELFSESEKLGMTEKNESGEYVITKPYQKTMKAEERFRIGSVDAFQGKEFDVVILSLVRSNTIHIKSHLDIRKKYGFLTSFNRLNVAMSRAKKLLITVGDEEMFKIQQAEEHIFGLYAFYKELINTDYGLSI